MFQPHARLRLWRSDAALFQERVDIDFRDADRSPADAETMMGQLAAFAELIYERPAAPQAFRRFCYGQQAGHVGIRGHLEIAFVTAGDEASRPFF